VSARRSSRSLLAALILAGCASLTARPPEPLAPDVHHLLDALHQRWARFEDLRSRVEVTLERAGQIERLTGVLLLKSPDSFRLEALSPWGQPFLILVSTGSSTTIYAVAENRAWVGPASARSTERWLGVRLEPTDLVGILSSYVLPVRQPLRGVLRPPDEFGPSLELTGSNGTRRIWLDPETATIRRVEFEEGKSQLRVIYEGTGPDRSPSALTLEAPDEQVILSIRYRSPETGVGIPPERFSLNLPQGTKVQRFR
jgi:outer membrane lipoprotein-sorting protein